MSIAVGFSGDRDELMPHGMERTEDIEAWPSGTRFDKQPLKTPQKAQTGTQNKISRIDKEHCPLACLRFL